MTGKTPADLPTVTAKEAELLGWWSMRQFAEWAKKPVDYMYDLVSKKDFPEVLGLLPSERGPNPHRLRDRDALKAWFQARTLRSKWTASADEIRPSTAKRSDDVLSLTEVCDASGLKASAVMSYVHRTGNPVRGAMAYLARPAFRVGAATPYWSRAQLNAYFEAAGQSQQSAEQIADLPELSPDEAERRALWSLPRLAEWAGFKPAHMYRMANEEEFPQPVAVVPSNGPNPIKVRDRAKVEAWFRARRPSWEPAAVQDGPR